MQGLCCEAGLVFASAVGAALLHQHVGDLDHVQHKKQFLPFAMTT